MQQKQVQQKQVQQKQGRKRLEIDQVLKEELAKGVTEYQFLRGWVQLYGEFLAANEELAEFLTGMRDYGQRHDLRPDLMPRALGDDGLTDETIRAAVASRVDHHRDQLAATLERLTYDQVRQLLKFWTGTDQLVSELRLAVVAESGRLPSAHTCSMQLDVPGNQLRDPELMARKIVTALEFGGVGTGFI